MDMEDYVNYIILEKCYADSYDGMKVKNLWIIVSLRSKQLITASKKVVLFHPHTAQNTICIGIRHMVKKDFLTLTSETIRINEYSWKFYVDNFNETEVTLIIWIPSYVQTPLEGKTLLSLKKKV